MEVTDMNDVAFTITLGGLLNTILIIVAIVAIIFLIILLAKVAKSLSTLPQTMAHVEKVMGDIEAITGVAKDGAEGAKAVVTKASAALTGIKQATDENRGQVRAAASLVNAVTGLVSLLKKK